MPMTGDSWGKVIHTSDWEKIKSWPVCETASLLGAAVPFGEWTARVNGRQEWLHTGTLKVVLMWLEVMMRGRGSMLVEAHSSRMIT
jgi:hypothetical protein